MNSNFVPGVFDVIKGDGDSDTKVGKLKKLHGEADGKLENIPGGKTLKSYKKKVKKTIRPFKRKAKLAGLLI